MKLNDNVNNKVSSTIDNNIKSTTDTTIDSTVDTTISTTENKVCNKYTNQHGKRFAIVYSFSLAKLLIKKGFVVKNIRKNYKLDKKEMVFYFDCNEAIESVIQEYCNSKKSNDF